jgi:maleate isomerase
MSETTGRIGVIYPSDGILDHEFWQCATPGVSVLMTRSPTALDFAEGLSPAERHEAMANSTGLEDAARTFAHVDVGCVAYACTGASFSRGVGYDAELIERISRVAGSPATTTTTALVAALRELGIHKLAVAAPYGDDVCARMRRFMTDSGFEVVRLENLGLVTLEIGRVTPEEVYALGRRAMVSEADGLLIACTALRTIEVLGALEQDLGKPVVSANQATIWHALRIAGLEARVDGVGSLYRPTAVPA